MGAEAPSGSVSRAWVGPKKRERSVRRSVLVGPPNNFLAPVRLSGVSATDYTAIRDGKSFQEFDPNSPLGDMRPPELPRKK